MKKGDFLYFFLILLSFVSCTRENGSQQGDEKVLKVVCSTTGMITDLAQRIGGRYVSTVGLMGPGIDPHLYRATQNDIITLSQADLILYNGLHLEGKMETLFESMREKKIVVAITQEMERKALIPAFDFEGEYDPHIWFDVILWMQAAQTVEKALSALDPSHETEYKKQTSLFLQELKQLDDYIRQQIETIPKKQRILVTAHDAFSYFGRRYGFQIVALQGVNTETESGILDIDRLANFIVQKKVNAIFPESSVPPKSIQALQEAVRAKGGEVSIGKELFSDSMGGEGTPESTYVGMYRHNIDEITSSLLQRTQE